MADKSTKILGVDISPAEIKKYATQILDKLTSDKAAMASFEKNAAAYVKKFLKIDVTPEAIDGIVTAIKAKLGVDQAKGAIDQISSLFKK